jgi:Flp pilus assembly protein TadB
MPAIYARNVSNDETGLVLLGVAVFFALLGYLLSRAGLKKVDEAAPQVRGAAVADQLDRVNEALEELTGAQAPARVAWAFCALCLAGSFVAFGLISLSVGS